MLKQGSATGGHLERFNSPICPGLSPLMRISRTLVTTLDVSDLQMKDAIRRRVPVGAGVRSSGAGIIRPARTSLRSKRNQTFFLDRRILFETGWGDRSKGLGLMARYRGECFFCFLFFFLFNLAGLDKRKKLPDACSMLRANNMYSTLKAKLYG